MGNTGFKIAKDYLTSLLTLAKERGVVKLNKGSDVFVLMTCDEYVKLKEHNEELQRSIESLLETMASTK